VTNLENGKILVSYQQEQMAALEIPSPAQAAKRPQEVENNEQLYLTGLHIEQYRHATYIATDYYEEALRRDDKDVRCNNAMGLWNLRRGQFAKAEPYFRKAITTLTRRNPNPYDGEAYYNLGWALKMQGRSDEAFDAFYKSVWNDAWQHAGYLNLARIACERTDYDEALELIEKSLVKNYHSHTARHLKAAILRKLEKREEAHRLIEESLAIDPFNYGCLFESYILYSDNQQSAEAGSVLKTLLERSRNWVQNFIEYAFDYAHAGLFEEASELLLLHVKHSAEPYPMVFYYLGWFAHRQGQMEKAMEYFKKAATLNPDFCFPNRIEDVPVLQTVMELNPQDVQAPYFLGNFWYDKRQYSEAIECWERSVQINDSFPTVHRNLSLAYYNKLSDPGKALLSLEKAFSLDTTDARVLMELDQLYKKLNTPHRRRLDILEKYRPLVESREDMYLERVTLYNQLGDYQKAKDLIAAFTFHPWEGGEGKVVGQYLLCHLELARQALKEGKAEEALQLLNEAENYPSNLGEGKLQGTQENDIHYLKALAFEQLGNKPEAEHYFNKATEGISVPVQAIFYNDPQPDKIFYQGLAWAKLGEAAKASAIFRRLIDFGQQHIDDVISIDYFAVSLPDLLVFDADLNLRNKVHCLYLMGLGHLGLANSNLDRAEACFNEVISLDVNHQGAAVHKQMMAFITLIEQ
jgi:tetratricopeptide (TPR) repeat protein